MSLMALRRSNGIVSVEVGYYYSMSLPAQLIMLQFVRYKGQGWFAYIGT